MTTLSYSESPRKQSPNFLNMTDAMQTLEQVFDSLIDLQMFSTYAHGAKSVKAKTASANNYRPIYRAFFS